MPSADSLSFEVAQSAQAVLFVCTANAVRSPMAAGLLHHSHGRRLYVRSAGIAPTCLDGFTVAVMQEIDIDLSQHQPCALEDLEDSSFDIIITLSAEAHHRALELTRVQSVVVSYWPTFDPSLTMGARDIRLDSYRAVRDALAARIRQLFPLPRGPAV